MNQSREQWLLIGLGVLISAIYMAGALLLPWWRYGGTLQSWSQLLGSSWLSLMFIALGIGGLVLAYLWGWHIVRKGGISPGIIWGFAALFALSLYGLLPITSDLFGYLIQAHLFTDLGASPLVSAPLEFGSDPLVRAYPTAYAGLTSIYGPAWILVSALGTLGSNDVVGGISYLKAVSAVAYLGSAWLLYRMLKNYRPNSALEGLYFFAWSPLVLLEAIGDGHNDMLMMALALLAMWLLLRSHWVLAFCVLALSIWIKYISIMYVPLFAIYASNQWVRWRHRPPWPVLAGGATAMAGISVLVFAPFWEPRVGLDLVERIFSPANWDTGPTELRALLMGAGLLVFGLVYGYLVWRFARKTTSPAKLMHVSFLVSLLAVILFAARSQPWHLIWPVSLASLSGRSWAMPVVTALSALVLGAQVWVEWGTPGV